MLLLPVVAEFALTCSKEAKDKTVSNRRKLGKCINTIKSRAVLTGYFKLRSDVFQTMAFHFQALILGHNKTDWQDSRHYLAPSRAKS